MEIADYTAKTQTDVNVMSPGAKPDLLKDLVYLFVAVVVSLYHVHCQFYCYEFL